MINDQEIVTKCREMKRFLKVFDSEFSVYLIQRQADLDLDSDILEDRQKRITVKWQKYHR